VANGLTKQYFYSYPYPYPYQLNVAQPGDARVNVVAKQFLVDVAVLLHDDFLILEIRKEDNEFAGHQLDAGQELEEPTEQAFDVHAGVPAPQLVPQVVMTSPRMDTYQVAPGGGTDPCHPPVPDPDVFQRVS
jgi:hypothetical protein